MTFASNTMTKNTFLLATSLSMMILGTQAFAASTIDLTVDGSITPAACTPTLSSNSVDYGDIHASTIAPWNHHIGIKTLSFNINCTGPTLIGVHYVDNRDGTEVGYAEIVYPSGAATGLSPNAALGFGLSPAGKNIGSYAMFMEVTDVDGGTSFDQLTRRIGGSIWETSFLEGVIFASGEVSVGAPGTLTPMPVTSLTSTLHISATLDTRDGLTFQDEVNMDGSAILSLVYL